MSQTRFARYILPIVAVTLLTGCSLDTLAFWRKAEYRVTGLESRPDLQKSVKTFLDTNVAAIQKSDNKAEQKDQEIYQERLLQGELTKKLQSEGYYDGKVEFRNADTAWSGTFAVAPGPQYKIDTVTVAPSNYARFLKTDPALRQGAPLNAAAVLKAQSALYTAIQKDQCYFTLTVENAVTLDKRAHTGRIVFNVAAGPHASFGHLTFRGTDSVRTSYLYRLVPWKRGGCFNRDDIEKYRTSLFESGLFSRVDAVLPDHPDANGQVPITFNLQDRSPRTISAGVNYYTDQGFGVTLGWKHRNLLGAAETLDTTLTVSQIVQNLTAKFSKPYFLRKDQSLELNASIDHEDTDAYKKLGIETGAAIKRNFSKALSGTTGIGLNIERINDQAANEKTNYALVSFPQSLTFDNRDSTLDPTRGWLLEGSVAPFIDLFGQSSPFWKTQGSARTYLGLTRGTILALRVKGGSILGPSTVNIPATERFYAGGGGSVRGFGYQDIGPTKNGEPAGGRSLIEGSAEMRFKLTDTFGMVAFLDAGSVDPSIVPNLDNLSVGTGLGVRYYTAFGPIRFDVGVPLNNKKQASGKYQFYISIGQAF